MADNVIQRIVRLIFDKASGKQTEEDAKKALGGVEGAMGSLKSAAVKLGAAIVAAFSIQKLTQFLGASVAAAREASRQYGQLAATIDATGASYEALEADVLAAADAFEAATIHDDGEYVEGLQRVIALTGDVRASMHNMGLVADVAAQFFNGELGPAADLVAKAMNGNVGALGRMGIAAESAQDALEILAERSFGAAAARAATFDGRLAQLNNSWGNFQKELGFAIIKSEGALTATNALAAAIQMMRDWVDRNRDAIGRWVTRGVDFAIKSVDVLYRAVKSLALIVEGTLVFAIGKNVEWISKLVSAYGFAVKAAGALAIASGNTGLAATLFGHAAAVDQDAKAITDWGAALASLGAADVEEGLRILATPAFTPGQFRPGAIPDGGTSLSVADPMVGSNAVGVVGEETKKELSGAEKAMQDFIRVGEQARIMESLLGDDFDHLSARASALQSVMAALAAEGFDENNRTMQGFAEELRVVTAEMAALEAASKTETAIMQQQAAVAGELTSALGASLSGGLGPHAKMKARSNLLEAAELTIRAGVAAITGFGAFHAKTYIQGAARHAAIAAAWSAFAGGAGGAAKPSLPSGGGGAAGGSSPLSTARSAAAGSAGRATPISPEMHFHFVGPGWDALNPAVQRVVIGAQQNATEVQGNVRVRTHRPG
jgi:hypothetical protein